MRASFGAYITPWEYEFSVGRTTVTTISLLGFIIFAIGQPLAGKLNDHFGKNIVPTFGILVMGVCLILTSRATQMWHVFAMFGVGFSIGIAAAGHNVSAAILTQWFVEKRGMALGLMTSGMAIGMLVLVPANLFIIREVGWRTAMLVFGIIIIATVGPLYLFLLKSKPEDKAMKPYGFAAAYESAKSADHNDDASKKEQKPLPVMGILKTKGFWFLAIPYFICGVTDVGLITTHIIPMAEGRGIPDAIIALAVSLIAIANIAGTIGSGYLSDRFSRKRQLAFIYAFRAVTFVLLIFMQQHWLLLVFAVGYGAVEMASIAPTNSVAADLFRKYSTGTVLGMVALSHQLGGALGSWVPGIMYDITGSYTNVLMVSVVLLLGMAFMSLGIPEESLQG